MVLEDLTVSELASRAGLRKSKVRKHLEPACFQQLPLATLEKYAGVFNVPVGTLVALMAENNTVKSPEPE